MPDQGKVVVVGASAGGVEALTNLVQALPGGFRAPVLVVLHVLPTGTSLLPEILGGVEALEPPVHAVLATTADEAEEVVETSQTDEQ